MKKPVRKGPMLILAVLLGVSGLSVAADATAVGTPGSTAAKTQWAKHHPRRHQVNQRLARQNRRIHREVKEGDLTRAQAGRLHRHDRAIRREERHMARQNGGYVTKGEQRALNRQENGVSRQIGQ